MTNAYTPFEEIAAYFDAAVPAAQNASEEEIIVRYTRGTGRFSRDKKYITLAMEQYTLDDQRDGYHEGVWEAQFTDPTELLQRPANPVGALNEPHGPVDHLAAVAQTKGIWVFGDGSSITAVGPAMSHLIPLDDGSFLFTVSCGQIITNGTGRYANAQGLKTSLGSTHIEAGVNLFGQEDVQFTATTVDTFRVIRDPARQPTANAGRPGEQASPDRYDYIVVGAGSAGCAVASRLSEDSSASVLLLDAGPDPEKEMDSQMLDRVRLPEMFQQVQDTQIDWRYWEEPAPALNFRQLFTPRGKAIGGTSIFIAGLFIRGNPRDYEEWVSLGNPGWGYEDVLPYFIKSENNLRPGIDTTLHGTSGPLAVGDIEPISPATEAFLAACRRKGFKLTNDFNDPQQNEAAGVYQVYVKDRVRINAANGYLTESVRSRSNLHIRSYAHASKLVIEGGRAAGVEYEDQSNPRNVSAKTVRANREVIVCCGAIESPKLLMLSGIGPAEDLRKHGIKVEVDLPGVGKNLQNHPVIPLAYKYSGGRLSPPPAASGIEGGMFLRSKRDLQSPDLQFVFNHVLLGPPGPLDPTGFMLVPVLVDPYSRGFVRLNSAYFHDPPEIQGNYLTDPADMRRLVTGVRIAMDILDTPPLKSIRGEKFIPVQPGVGASDKEIEAYIRGFAGTLFHPACTCPMGPNPRDPNEPAVVDAQLRVHGVQGLRVADASIMPRITTGNTHTPTVMIGERAADFIKRGSSGARAEAEPQFRLNMVLRIRERDVEKFRSLMGPLVRMPQQGLLRFEIHADPNDRTRYISSEIWESKAAWEAREAGRHYQEFFIPQVAPLVAEAKPLEHIAAWDANAARS